MLAWKFNVCKMNHVQRLSWTFSPLEKKKNNAHFSTGFMI